MKQSYLTLAIFLSLVLGYTGFSTLALAATDTAQQQKTVAKRKNAVAKPQKAVATRRNTVVKQKKNRTKACTAGKN